MTSRRRERGASVPARPMTRLRTRRQDVRGVVRGDVRQVVREVVRTAGLASVLVALLVGCGSAHGSGTKGDAGSSSASSTVGGCAPDSGAVTGARTVGSADLDGDGSADQVRLTPGSSACPDALFAKVAGGYVATHLGGGGLPVTRAYAVALPGRDGQLLVTQQDHPRGGFQLRVFAADHGDFAELRADGQPLVPFVATDVQEHPWSIACSDGGVVVTEAVPHGSIGVVSWDVRQTTYAVHGSVAQKGSTRQVAAGVRPGQLGRKYPDLVRHVAFARCRAG